MTCIVENRVGYDAPSSPLVGRGFLPSAIAVSQDFPPLEIKACYAPEGVLCIRCI